MSDTYARWASTYSPDAHNRLMGLEQRAVLGLLPDPAGRRALDLACGSGRYLRELIDRRAALAFGIDLSPHMLDRARAISNRLIRADLLSLPIPSASLDLLVCGLAVGHVADLGRAIAEMGRVLKPDGSVVYSDFHPVGSLAGWRRAFRAEDGREYVARHHTHLYADHQSACRAAGLLIEDVREPRIDFEHEWRGCPAVIVLRARKIR